MATQKDIAREAGVSNSLVSYYLTGSKSARMSDETRKRIDAAIRKLNYRPNQLARSLRTGRSKSIGMLIGNISDSYFGHLAEEVLDAARKHDYSLILAMTKNEPQERANALEFLMRNRIDALLSCSSLTGIPELVESIRKSRLLLCNDSGPMHIAAGVGTPVTAMFGPTDPVLTGPFSDQAEVLTPSLDCCRCFKRTCDTCRCHGGISPAKVVESMEKLLGF